MLSYSIFSFGDGGNPKGKMHSSAQLSLKHAEPKCLSMGASELIE
ncbi:hypothetical protein MY8738_004057 [Beauveria namnaoensis]